MGCCTSGQVEVARNSYEEAWQVFRATDLSKPERFTQNRQRIFHFLFLSVLIPANQQTRDRVAAFADSLAKSNPALPDARREVARLENELHRLQDQHRKFHQELSKRIKSDMLSAEDAISKEPNPRGSRRNERDRDVSDPPLRPEGDQRPQEQPDALIESAINEPRLRSSYEYSIPLTILDSCMDTSVLGEPLTKEERLEERLEFEEDKRQALEKQVQLLAAKVELQAADLAELGATRKALLEELQVKEGLMKAQGKEEAEESRRMREEIIELNRQKDDLEDRIIQLTIERDQFRNEMVRLDREQAHRQDAFVKIKDTNETQANTFNITSPIEQSCNFSMNFLQPRPQPMLAVGRAFEERIDPTILPFLPGSFSRELAMRSYIVVEEERDEREEEEASSDRLGKYDILFNLFANSKVLPTHLHFQAAVGTRTLIRELFERPPLRSELLFTFDSISPNHYAPYIRERENLLLLAALPGGVILGGFAGRFAEDKELKESFLFSLSEEREPVKLVPNGRVRRIDLDPSFLIFGNSELRLKAKTLELTSNLGSFQSVYCWGKRAAPLEKFLGTSERNLLLANYEIHQLHFA